MMRAIPSLAGLAFALTAATGCGASPTEGTWVFLAETTYESCIDDIDQQTDVASSTTGSIYRTNVDTWIVDFNGQILTGTMDGDVLTASFEDGYKIDGPDCDEVLSTQRYEFEGTFDGDKSMSGEVKVSDRYRIEDCVAYGEDVDDRCSYTYDLTGTRITNVFDEHVGGDPF